MSEYLSLGKILKPVGLKGEVKIYSTTNNSDERYGNENLIFYLGNEESDSNITAKAEHFRSLGQFDVVKFDVIKSIEDADKFIGMTVFTKKDQNLLSKDEYYFDDLVSCEIFDAKSKKYLGTVAKIEEFPAQITLNITKEDGKSFYVPFINVFINKVDIKNKKIYINVIDGLI